MEDHFPPWKVEQQSTTVTTIRLNYTANSSWTQWVLLSSDRHLDNPLSDWKLQKKHLNQAKEVNAPVIDTGDLFCAMQGKYDPRSRKSAIRDSQCRDDYYDYLVTEAESFFEPFKNIVTVFGLGNHETAILKRNETDLTGRLVRRLGEKSSQAVKGGYRGWVRFLFATEKGSRQSFRLYFSHGSNGNAPVSKGVLMAPRRAVWLPDADIVCAGHIHEQWHMPITRARLSSCGKEYRDEQHHIQIPTYKDEFFSTSEGFHHEKERPPKPIGAWWLKFTYDRSSQTIKVEPIRAK